MDAPHENQALLEALQKHGEARRQIAALQVEAASIGGKLIQLGMTLRDAPESVMFEKESWDGPFEAKCLFDLSLLDAQRIRQLVNTYRSETVKSTDAKKLISRHPNGGDIQEAYR